MNSFTFNFNEMKKLFIKLVFFLIPLCLYLSANLCYNYDRYRNESVNLGPIEDLIIGDSQLMTALNPFLFKNAVNVCQSGEPLIVSYWKLKKILNSSKPLRVYLGFSPHTISSYNEHKFSDKKWAQDIFRKIYPIQDLNSISARVEIDFTSFYKTLFKQNAFYPKTKHTNYLGCFIKKTSSDVSNWELRTNQHFFYQEKLVGKSQITLDYLDSIIDLCQQFDLSLTLLGSPLHRNYYSNIPQSFLIDYKVTKAELEQRGICIIDKSDGSSYSDSSFYDSNHLNQIGANRFTTEVLKLLISQGKFN
jgi:hypothetical protein